MKRIITLAAFMLILPQLALAASTLPTIFIDKIDPQPVEPGKDLTVDITLYNQLNSPTGDFSVELESAFPIIFKSARDDLSGVNLCAGCKQTNKYFLTVAPTAVSGTYTAYIFAHSGTSGSRQNVTIKVQGKPNIIFSSQSDTLDSVVPNKQFTVVLDMENLGSGQARQVRVQPDSASFVVLGGGIQSIDTIDPGETRQVSFDLVAASTLIANSYSVPFKISYLDEQGALVNTTQNLGLRVVNKGEINLQSVKAASSAGGLLAAGQPFTIVIRLENVGEGDADGIVAEVSCPFNGARKAFVGRLEKDEDAPAVFEMTTSASGSFRCDLSVSYRDDTGEHVFADQFDLNIEPPNFGGMIFMLIVLAIILFVFRKRVMSILGLKKQQPHHK